VCGPYSPACLGIKKTSKARGLSSPTCMPEPDFIFFLILLKGAHNLESVLIFFFIKKQTTYRMFYAESGDHRLLEK